MGDSWQISNSSVLVTGGAGFIGSNLCDTLLEQNNRVICLDNFITGKQENITGFLAHTSFELIEGDIRNPEDCRNALKGVDHVLHQAALGSVPRSVHDPMTTNEINVSGFLNMIWAAKEAGLSRFVYATSSSTYGDHPGLPKQEDQIGKPLSPYAVSKYVNELYATVFSDLFRIETIGLRYFNVFGKRQDTEGAYAAAIPRFIKQLMNGLSPVVYGDGMQTRDFTYVKNVIQANQQATTTNDPNALNQVYNIAFGERTTINELIRTLKGLLAGFDPSIGEIEVKYEEERAGEVKHSFASVEKAKKFLGYKPTHDLREGLQEAIEWYWESLKPV